MSVIVNDSLLAAILWSYPVMVFNDGRSSERAEILEARQNDRMDAEASIISASEPDGTREPE
jgi:hypothetical protein